MNIYRKLQSNKIVIFNSELSKRNSIKVMAQEWDYLIVLDACRYDVYREVVNINTPYVISGGSCTQEWLEWNFKNYYENVIYIAGNPHFASLHLKKSLGFNPFYHVDEVWNYGWDEEIGTVPPLKVTQAALRSIKMYPNKKMIIHYNQPHHPFLTNKDFIEKDDGTWGSLNGGLWGGKKKTIWYYAESGEIPIYKLKEAYKKNLEIVMEEVDILVKELRGSIVITSDHGNLFGKYGLYGHRCNFRAEGLVKVPWAIIENRV
jgi:hypothetical protein